MEEGLDVKSGNETMYTMFRPRRAFIDSSTSLGMGMIFLSLVSWVHAGETGMSLLSQIAVARWVKHGFHGGGGSVESIQRADVVDHVVRVLTSASGTGGTSG